VSHYAVVRHKQGFRIDVHDMVSYVVHSLNLFILR